MNARSLPRLLAVTLPMLSADAQEFRSFVGANNTLWESPSNWNPNLVPDSVNEGARLDNGVTVVVGGSHLISALEIRAGNSLAINQSNVLGTNTLAIDGAGTISGPGTLRLTDTGFINDGSGMSFSNVTFRNEGTLDLFTSISLSPDAVFQNVNTTTFADNMSIGIGSGTGSPPIIENTGFLRKDLGTGNAGISPAINNDHEIACTSGTFSISGDIDSSGQFRTGTNGTIVLTGNNTLTDGASIFGDGVTRLNSGTIEVPTGATVTFDNFELRGGQLVGDGTIEHLGNENFWASGILTGTLTSRVPSGAVLSIIRQGNGPTIAGNHAIVIESGGTLSFPDDNSLITSNGTTSITNSGLVEFGGDGDISQNGPYPSTLMLFTNAAGGSVVKQAGSIGSDTTRFIADINHLGSFDVQGGELVFLRKVDSSAPMNVAAGAIIKLSGPSLTPSILRPGSGFTGSGLVENNTITEVGAGAVVGVPKLDLLTGTLNGAGTILLNDEGNWNGGQIGGTMTLHIQSGATFRVDGSGSRTIASSSAPHFDNDGTFEVTGSANISSNGSATFDNSGTLFFDGSADLTRNSGTNTAITNTGSIIKEDGGQSGSSATSLLQVDLTHSGTAEVRSGTLFLQGNHDLSAPISVSSGATLRLDGSGTTTTFRQGSAITGDGTVEQRSANFIIADGARIPINHLTTPSGSGIVGGSGTLVLATDTTLTRIRHEDTGTTEIPAGITLTTGTTFQLTGGRTLHNLGSVQFPSSFNSTSTGGATIANDGVIDFNTSCTINHGGGTFALRNDGIIRCNAGGTSSVSLPVDSLTGNGRIEVNSGRLRLTRPLGITGVTVLATGTQISGSSSTVNFAPGSTIAGTGTISGNATFAGQVAPGQSIGTLTVGSNATFTPGSTLAVELGNGSSDQLVVTSTLDLGGLRIAPTLVPGTTPTDGTTWTIATANAITGSTGLVDQSAAAPGFAFFAVAAGNNLQLTYAEVSGFQQAYEAATGQSLGPNPDLNAIGEGDVDSDGLADVLDWLFSGNLGGPDPARRSLLIDSISDIGGGLIRIACRYPLNPAATDVIVGIEKDTTLSGSFNPTAFTPTGTTTIDGILFQQVTVDSSATPATTFLRLRASFPTPP